MKKRTKKNRKYQFEEDTRRKIWERDNGNCIFCARNYHMENQDEMSYQIKDIMHYINKSKGGLGIPENGAVGCRYHHGLLDNGNRGLREEMLHIFREHLKTQYQGWNPENLIFKKRDVPSIG